MGPPWLGPEKTFQNGGSHMARKRDFEISFCNLVNASFDYTFFQMFYKHYMAFNSSKIT